MAIKICLDAGHYGKRNRSTVVPEYYESDMSWKLHLMLRKRLEEKGFEVITTRPNQAKDVELYDRGTAAKGCDLFMSLHSNATGTPENDEEAARFEKVDRVDIYAPLDGKAHDLAKMLADKIVEVMGNNQGGNVKTRKGNSGKEYYGVLRGAAAVKVPGLLVEHSFHTNTRTAKWLLEDSNLEKLAKAEAEVLAEYFADRLDDSIERTLHKGSEGDDVEELQEKLLDLGYDLGTTGAKKNGVDGDFGTKTENAVKDFQKKYGLTVDGIVGPKTHEALAKAFSRYQLVIEGDEATLRAVQKDHGGVLMRVE